MSLLSYRSPGRRGDRQPELGESECDAYLREAEACKKWIPPGLSFEELVKNKPSQPCSLNDFMDYLVYVEHGAECLQFFLWYCDYIERWSRLPQDEKDLSPAWDPKRGGELKNGHPGAHSPAEKTERLNRIIAILESTPDNKRTVSSLTNFSWPRTPTLEGQRSISGTLDDKYTRSQPFQEEVSKVVHHYIATYGVRRLNLTHQDRWACILAAKQTTHPSALLPAFTAAEALLRGRYHPNFIKWSVSNCSRPRLVVVVLVATAIVLMGFLLDLVLVLSNINRFVRIAAVPLWCTGISVLLAARHGICMVLHWSYRRSLRPWDQFSADGAESDCKCNSDNADVDADDDDAGAGTGDKEAHGDETAKQPKFRSKHRCESMAGISRLDPLRKPSLQFLGPANDFADEPWVEIYRRKSLWAKALEPTIRTQDGYLKAEQDRILFKAAVLGVLGSILLGVGFIFIPSPELF
ncbi:hypothetical protein BX600DRAFT_122469 [Xylariales sp. PMI_506]|nr:hypothetical protein BX600DRAFT_122469 [Xylariales sp. PMI_506]